MGARVFAAWGPSRPPLLVAVLVLVSALFPAAAWSHNGKPHKRLSERKLQRMEQRIYGPEHAREHSLSRRQFRRDRARYLRMSPAQRRRRVRAMAAATGDPATEGRWTAPFPMPAIATHAALLPTGKVLFFSQKVNDYKGHVAAAHLWDPTKAPGTAGEFTSVTPPVNIWCGAQSLMADGQLLVTGGNLAYASSTTGYAGMKTVFTFDPWSETWTRQPDMARGRWYPTQTLLPDGRTLITSGYDEKGGYAWNTDIDTFNPPSARGGQGSLATIARYGSLANAPFTPHWYPHWFVMPSGKVLNAGFKRDESWLLTTTPGAVTGADRPDYAVHRKYGSAVLMPGGPSGSNRVMQLGGYDHTTSQKASLTSTEVFDEGSPTQAPVSGPAMRVARSHQNTVLLPDRSMINIGGGYGEQPNTEAPENANENLAAAGAEHKQIEILDAGSASWRLGPSQVYKRAYHSTGLLLPDGRVLSAGDDRDPAKGSTTFREKDIGEIYEPAYLHKTGERPSITSAPSAVGYGQGFSISTTTAISSAVLVAPGATTHANDMHQRLVPLSITPSSTGTGATLTAPANANIAPPGYYMLFALSANGKPSVAEWVRVGGSASPPPADTTAPAAPTGLSATAGDASVSLSWAASASSDVVRYDVYRTAPGTRTKVSSASQGTSLTFRDTGLTNGTTYSYVVRAVDGAGNESVDSGSASATPAATPPPSGSLASDAFSRTVSGGWGSADGGGAWSSVAGGTSPFSVNGAQGVIETPTGGLERHAVLSAVSVRDVDASVAITFPSSPGSGRHIAQLTLRRQSGGGYFRIGLVATGSTLYLRGQTSGGTSLWGDLNTGLGFAAGNTYRLRTRAEGANPTTIRARVWKAGTAEPTSWTASNSTNTTGGPQVAGAVGVRTFNDSGTATSLRFDDFSASGLGGGATPPPDTTAPAAPTALSAAAGDGSVSLSWAASSSGDVVRYDVYRVSPGSRTKVSSASQGTSTRFTDTGLTNGTTYSYVVRAVDGAANESVDSNVASATPTATSSPPPPTSSFLAADTFSRITSGGWGSADSGGAWSVVSGGTAPFSVDGSSGLIATPTGGLERHAVLGSVSVRDVDAKATITFPSSPGTGRHIAYLTMRRQAGVGYFRVGLVATGSNLYVRGQTSSGQSLWGDVNTNLGFAAGNRYVIRVQAEGANPTTVRARVWKAGTAEPTTWGASNNTNTSGGPQTAGAAGVRTFNDSTTDTTFRFDDLTVSQIGG